MQALIRKQVANVARSISTARTQNDRRNVQRSAEHIYNIAARNENELTKLILTRREVQRCPQRMEWVRERMAWRLIKDDCKLIVELVNENGTS